MLLTHRSWRDSITERLRLHRRFPMLQNGHESHLARMDQDQRCNLESKIRKFSSVHTKEKRAAGTSLHVGDKLYDELQHHAMAR